MHEGLGMLPTTLLALWCDQGKRHRSGNLLAMYSGFTEGVGYAGL